jgi:hypothetical protein
MYPAAADAMDVNLVCTGGQGQGIVLVGIQLDLCIGVGPYKGKTGLHPLHGQA